MKPTSMRFTFILSLIICLTFNLTGCSNKAKEDTAEGSSDVSDVASDGSSADAEIDASAGETAEGDTAALDAAAPETAEVDLGASAPAEGTTDSATEIPADSSADLAQADPNAGAATDSATETPVAPPVEDAAAANNDLFGAGSEVEEKVAKKRTPTPLQHIKDAPFKKGGQLLNTVYVAREGDTLKSVSEALFAKDEVKKLKKANPSLKNNLKAGDKVYFNSPARADDADRMLVVFEDQGLPPTTYTTKEGDTLKGLAKEWFGNESAWKEVYAINRSLASTKELPAGTELIYWPPTAVVTAYNAKDAAPEVASADGSAPAPTDANMPGGAQPNMADNSAGGMPPSDPNAPPPPPSAGSTGAPPTDVAQNMAPPPPPPPPVMDASAASKAPRKTAKTEDMDKDMIMMMVAAGAGLLVLAILIAARRARARRTASANLTQV